MRIDVVTIFPDYLAPLGLSLAGKAQEQGLLDVRVHDLRDWTTDRHRTVDDAPYGGGAGMVMRPEPWGEALDALLAETPAPTIVVPTPAGVPFRQSLARDLATRQRLVFLCGRYEGIDQRVLDDASGRAEVLEVSVGDYVLNGGEVAALAITEAVVRLLPGFMGNPESLAEESHEQGLLEYPVYTRPPSWRGHDVPDVLLSGDHGAVDEWRRERSLRRTAERRPDLVPRAPVLDGIALRPGVRADAGELLVLQRACWAGAPSADLPAESVADVAGWLEDATVLVATAGERVVGAVRGCRVGEGQETWRVDRLMVAPDLQGRGIGARLLAGIEQAAPAATGCEIALPAGEERALRWLRRAGYRPVGQAGDALVLLRRPR